MSNISEAISEMSGRGYLDARQAVQYLKGRIAEQGVQERRQKVLDDIQLIKKRRNEEDNPVGEGHDQEMWFAKLERNQIWSKVFEFLTSPSDVTSVYFSCETFRRHLEEKRRMLALPKVFDVLRTTGRLEHSNNIRSLLTLGHGLGIDTCVEDRREKNKDILNLRLVSKAWKDAAEQEFLVAPLGFFQPDWYRKQERSDDELITGIPLSLSCNADLQCRFECVEDVEKAIAALQYSKSCSSLIRTILVEDPSLGDIDFKTFYSKISDFLDNHGETVWRLKFAHTQIESSGDFYYEGVCKIVSKTPNLKALDIFLGHLFERGRTGAGNEDVNVQFQQMLLRCPFPNIPSLEFCRLGGFPKLNEPLIVEILRKNPSLKAVTLRGWSKIPDGIWSALRDLRLEYFNLEYEVESSVLQNDLLKLRQFDWPLKFLHLYSNTIEIDASSLFEVYRRFNDSLVGIKVRPLRVQVRNDGGRVVGDFPKLKEIHLPQIEN